MRSENQKIKNDLRKLIELISIEIEQRLATKIDEKMQILRNEVLLNNINEKIGNKIKVKLEY